MKATIDQNGMDPTGPVEHSHIQRRAPGFVSDDDCLNKFEAMDEGTFEDPLGLLVRKGQGRRAGATPETQDGTRRHS